MCLEEDGKEVEPNMRSLSLPHYHLSQGRETKMNKKSSSREKVKPEMLIKETLYKTKKFCHKTLTIVKSFTQKLPKTPAPNPIFFGSNRIKNTKIQELDDFYRSFSGSIEVVKKKEGQISPKVQIKEDEQYNKSSMSVSDGFEDLKQEKKESKYSGRKQKESSFRAANALAQKMKELDMMDVNDMDHVLDIEEVLHYYSRLTCPAYLEIVDNFFIDMYSEFHVPQPSRSVNSSMRKLGSAASVHSSMRSLGPLRL